ncbi:hypothetical protein [Deinococcus rubellus]|uniref:hypothetical protein n=1 Tax=Deinococcus rubellus TaxID=1889240 RepID=UPI0031EBDEEE
MLYTLATLTTLGVLLLKRNDAAFATSEAWTHAGIVCIFAVVLLSVVRRAAAGGRGAYRRLQIVSAVLPVVSLLEAVIPGLFPTWMRVEQLSYAGLLLAVALLVRSFRPTLP